MMTISSGGVLFLILLGAVAGFTVRHLIARSDKKFELGEKKRREICDSSIDKELNLTRLQPIRVDTAVYEKLAAKSKEEGLNIQAHVRLLINRDVAKDAP